MIGMLTGKVALRGPDHVVLDVGGVGYVVFCSEATLRALPARGEVARLYTELLVREDLLQLFGFLTPAEREWHRLLTSVQGVGAKGALSIQGTLGANGLSRAIALGDWNAVKAAPGVGPKIAQRIVNELKDKAAGVMAMEPVQVIDAGDVPPAAPAGEPVMAAPAPSAASAAQSEALSALLNLGYTQGDAAAAVATALAEDEAADTATVIRRALRALAPKG